MYVNYTAHINYILNKRTLNSTADKLSDFLHHRTSHYGSSLPGSELRAVVLAFSWMGHLIVGLPFP